MRLQTLVYHLHQPQNFILPTESCLRDAPDASGRLAETQTESLADSKPLGYWEKFHPFSPYSTAANPQYRPVHGIRADRQSLPAD